MKTLIVYRSVLGTTKKYAHWLAKDLQADVLSFDQVNKNTFENYDLIVVSSGTYAGKMPLVEFLKKYWTKLESKKVIVVAVGIAPADTKDSQKSYEMIPEDIRGKIEYFKIPGSMFWIEPAGKPSKSKLDPVVSYIQGLN